MSFDANGVRVSGAIKAKGARAFWTAGFLYVAHSLTKVDVLASSEPVAAGGGWRVVSDGGTTTILRPSCGCQRKKDLGQATQEQLIAAASVSV